MNGHTQAIKCANHFFQLRLLLAATCLISTKSWSWCYTLTFLTQFGPRDVNDTVLAWIRRPHISHAIVNVSFTDFVGFSAYAIDDQSPANGDVIELPGVETNAGGAYNPNTSTFTCPTTAYYYIYFSLCLRVRYSDNDDCNIDITMDDSRIVRVRYRHTLALDPVMFKKMWCIKNLKYNIDYAQDIQLLCSLKRT